VTDRLVRDRLVKGTDWREGQIGEEQIDSEDRQG